MGHFYGEDIKQYFINQIEGEINNLKKYGNFEIRGISLSFEGYEKIYSYQGKDIDYIDYQDGGHPYKFNGYNIYLNPYQDREWVVLINPVDEFQTNVWNIRNK